VIVVRAARRPGQGGDGFDLCRATIASVDREGGHGHARVLVVDGALPAGGIPDHWRTMVNAGPAGARASLWSALLAVRGGTRPVLFLEDDIVVAPFATDIMLAASLRGIALASFFYPVYAQPHERKPRRPGMEIWNIHQFGYTQAFLMGAAAIEKVITGDHWPPPPMGGPHGGDMALRSALYRAGYDTVGVCWPNLVEHTGGGAASLVEPNPARVVRSGWFAGDIADSEARP
jgi:hypothetical protein